jgi:hypothetical protein
MILVPFGPGFRQKKRNSTPKAPRAATGAGRCTGMSGGIGGGTLDAQKRGGSKGMSPSARAKIAMFREKFQETSAEPSKDTQ